MTAKKVFKNTLALYFRQIIVTVISLFVIREVLVILGISDYGLFTVVTGIVSLCVFIPGALGSATQRFFSYAIGKGEEESVAKIYYLNLVVYLIVSIVLVIIMETIGLWFVMEHLNIPEKRHGIAVVLYHASVATFVFTLMTSPFMSLIIAKEDMRAFAYISIVEALLKLISVLILSHVSTDKLEAYGCFLLLVSTINFSLYVAYCYFRYSETRQPIKSFDKALFKELVDFIGWTFFGAFTSVIRTQAVTLLVNQMFNPVVVAARGIAVTVSTQAMVFANSFNTGLYPTIIKSYASGNHKLMSSSVYEGSKLSFFLIWIFALPLITYMDEVLSLWLINPPSNVTFFSQLALIEVLIMSLGLSIATAARAPGKMKEYELKLGFIQILIFLLSWVILLLGGAAHLVFFVAILGNIAMLFIKVHLVDKLIGLKRWIFFKSVLLPLFPVVLISSIIALYVKNTFAEGFLFMVFGMLTIMSISSITMYFIAIPIEYRDKIKSILKKKLVRKVT